jgi:hypothetical protein
MVSQEHGICIPSGTPAFPNEIQNFGAYIENLKKEHARRAAQSPHNEQLDPFAMDDLLSSAPPAGQADTSIRHVPICDESTLDVHGVIPFTDTNISRSEAGRPTQLSLHATSLVDSTPSTLTVTGVEDDVSSCFKDIPSWTFEDQPPALAAGAQLDQQEVHAPSTDIKGLVRRCLNDTNNILEVIVIVAIWLTSTNQLCAEPGFF